MNKKLGWLTFGILLCFSLVGCGGTNNGNVQPPPATQHSAYVVNYNATGNSSTMKIDVLSNQLVAVQTVGEGANAEFLSADGTLFTANTDGDSVSYFSTMEDNGPVTTLPLPAGSQPMNLGSTQEGTLYVINYRPNSVCSSSGSLSVIHTKSSTLESTICLGDGPSLFTQLPNGGKVYVPNSRDNTVSVYDPTQGVIRTINTLGYITGLIASPNGAYLFLTADSSHPGLQGVLDILDTANDSDVAYMGLGVQPQNPVLDRKRKRLYIPSAGSKSVTVLDVSTVNLDAQPPLTTVATLTFPDYTSMVAALPDGSKLYVCNGINVSVVDAETFATLKTIPIGFQPVSIAADPSSKKIYLADYASSKATIIETATDTVVASISAPAQDPTCTSSCALQRPVMILAQ